MSTLPMQWPPTIVIPLDPSVQPSQDEPPSPSAQTSAPTPAITPNNQWLSDALQLWCNPPSAQP